MGISIWQLLIILVIVLLLFGAKRLRNVGADLGSAVKGFKKSMQDDDENPPQIEKREGETVEGESVPDREKDKS